jgi:Zn-dependent metalloprotease
MIGEQVYTPSTAGDALRYMDDPKKAQHCDYYPDRYVGTADNGGVHSNSGSIYDYSLESVIVWSHNCVSFHS